MWSSCAGAGDEWQGATARIIRVLAFVSVVLATGVQHARALDSAEAATKPPVAIDIFVSSRIDACYDPGDVAAISRMSTLERDRINSQGGIAGHRLELRFRDDFRDEMRATENMREALAASDTIAMIGLPSSQRSKSVFNVLGEDIKTSRIPFISAISVNMIFAGHPNVFTMRASQEDERLPVLAQFVASSGFTRPAFVGLKEMLFSTTLGDGLNEVLSGGLVADHRLTLKDDDTVDEAELAAVVPDLKEKAADVVFLSIGQGRNVDIIRQLQAAGISPAVFVSGRISSIPAGIANTYRGPLYEVAWDRLPDISSDRLMKRLALSDPKDWIFEGAKNERAPGWATGVCQPRPALQEPDLEADANLRAIGIGTQYADMIALIAAAARTADRNADLPSLHAHILERLATAYTTGRGVFQGDFENWSFDPSTRTAARTPFIVQLAPGVGRTQLAPIQFMRLRNEALRAVKTQYMDIDLIRIFSVDDNEKTFDADFYLSLRDDGDNNSIELFEFSNAVINPETNDRQITVRVLSDGTNNEAFPDGMKIYQVTGRFLFQPDLEAYPFDTQRFSIDIRPKQGDKPFIVQPPPQVLRDTAVNSHGWTAYRQFVGYDEDFVTTVDVRNLEPNVVPFYKASFVWLMSRETTDYFLRVVVPLLFILAVAYLSIFIPLSHFEAIVTIQVTALLSAVALYLSLPEIDGDVTTVSDRIFLFNYMATTLMIGISVLRINGFVSRRPRLQKTLAAVHVLAVPLLALAMGYYLHQATLRVV